MTQAASNRDELLEVLYRYVDLGFALIPLWGLRDGVCCCAKGKDCGKNSGKHPNWKLAPNGKDSASRDKVIIAEWLRRYPNSNWAARTGEPLASGAGFAVVVDVDPRNGGNESIRQIQELQGDLNEETWIQDTGGGGDHYIYAAPRPPASKAPAPGVEILGEGKYFVIGPGPHYTGGEYTWRLGHAPWDLDIAPAPEWLCEPAAGTARPVREGDGTARDTVLGEAFALTNQLGVPFPDGSIAVTCPWADEHSDGRGRGQDSSTVILPPAGGSRFGGFKCMHSHCSQRTWTDVRQKMPPGVMESAFQKFPLLSVIDGEGTSAGSMSRANENDGKIDLKALRERLLYIPTKNGFRLKHDVVNLITILKYDPRWTGVLQYDEFGREIRLARQPDWHDDDRPKVPVTVWTDHAESLLDSWLRRNHQLELDQRKLRQGIIISAKREAFNPLTDWLNSLEWDGLERLDQWTTTYLGAEDTDYARLAGAMWMISAVARAYEPGCKADHVLILEGPQGRGKSTALEILASKVWFTDSPIDIGSKDAYLNIRGKWIIELGELASFKKADLDKAKVFFTSRVDRYRPPYGTVPEDFPRTCVFAGTVNYEEYLGDPTGNRRFWPISCGILDLAALQADRDQLWAEAVARYRAGSRWHPVYSEIHLFEKEQAGRVIQDIWYEPVRAWIERKDIQALVKSTGLLKADYILFHCLGIKQGDQTKVERDRLSNVMNSLGWEHGRKSLGGKKEYGYKPKSAPAAA